MAMSTPDSSCPEREKDRVPDGASPRPAGLSGGREGAAHQCRGTVFPDGRPPSFLAGGGELGELIRAFDWASTSLGRAESWPQSLKTAVRIMLTSRQPIWIGWGSELIYLYNDAYKSIIGGKHPRALGRPAFHVWREIWDDIGPLLATAMKGDEGIYVEEQLLIMERNGYAEETYYTFSYSPIPTDDGSAGGIICANTDDTQRVIGERQLALLRELAAGAGDARTWQEACDRCAQALATNRRDLPFAMIYLADPDGRHASLAGVSGIERGHPAARDLLPFAGPSNWPMADVLRTNEPKFVPDLRARFSELPAGSWSQPPSQAAVLPIAASGETGRAGVLIVGLSPFRLFDGGYRGFLNLVAGQIAAAIANAQAYEEERRRAEALAEIDRAKTAFFSNVSHEFRTPLTLMVGPLEDALAHADELPSRRRGELRMAHRNALRLLRLVNALLDFSRAEAGRMQARFEPTELPTLTRDLASNFQSVCERAGVKLVIDCEPLSRPIHVDREMWEKIVLNLVSNAFKFTFSGSIEVRLRDAGGQAELTVSDTGVGIPAQDLPKVFERFHRVEGQRSRTHEGTGIGLALVRELVNLHGGQIHVDSEDGRGTTVQVRIPCGAARPSVGTAAVARGAPAATRADAFVEEALRWLPGDPEAAEDIPRESASPAPADVEAELAMPRPRVLVADDNADMRDYIRRLLQRHYEVEMVHNGAEAIEVARREKPDLLLSDIMMPELDGFEMLREIRRDPALNQLPVILLSARVGEDAKVEGLDLGADDYLVKPFSARELLARVKSNIAMARLRREIAGEVELQKARLQTVLETVPAAVWFTFDTDGRQATGNRRACELLRIDSASNASLSAPPDERPVHFHAFQNGVEMAHAMLPLQRAARGETVSNEEIELRFVDGTAVALLAQAAPLHDRSGKVIGAVCACIDISERKRVEDHRMLLLNELNHRVKNTLATVQSIAAQSFKASSLPPTARLPFEDRLMALSRAHNVLTRESWDGANLQEIVVQAVLPYQGDNRGRFRISGPHVRLSAKMALAISMALHELATNAVKYGALSNEKGNVHVAWHTELGDGGRRLSVEWSETNGPPVAAPAQKGFGSRLIERGLAQELGGRAHIEYRPIGIVCTISAPLRGMQ